jgi:hypothetical protein
LCGVCIGKGKVGDSCGGVSGRVSMVTGCGNFLIATEGLKGTRPADQKPDLILCFVSPLGGHIS